MRRGQGVWLELDDGRRLIDGISSWWVTLHGHGEPCIAEAIGHQARELEQVIFANFRHGPASTWRRGCAVSGMGWIGCFSPTTAPPRWKWP